MTRRTVVGFLCLTALTPFCGAVELTEAVCISGNQISISAGKYTLGDKTLTVKSAAQFAVPDVTRVQVKDEGMVLPKSPVNPGLWSGNGRLLKLRIAGITACGSLDPESVVVVKKNRSPLKEGEDYLVEKLWGRVVMGPSGAVADKEPVFVSYTCRVQRLDTVAADESGELHYMTGEAAMIAPQLPALPDGYTAMFNVYRPYDSSAVLKEYIFPNAIDSKTVKTGSTPGCIQKTLAKLKAGEPVKIVCWGDSVTVGADLASQQERYSDRLEKQLKEKFPQAKITVSNISIGGTQSSYWLRGMDEKTTNACTFTRVLDAKPDLVTLEFVNDANLPGSLHSALYSRIVKELSAVGSELILITPHFTNPVLMGTQDLRTKDPRPYVQFLKDFSAENSIALADASARWENLYRSGLPYTTLLANGWNHPDRRGHAIFAEELMKCLD
jgi:lysophospholipase L1-like esterase